MFLLLSHINTLTNTPSRKQWNFMYTVLQTHTLPSLLIDDQLCRKTILQHLLPSVLVSQHPCLLTGGCVSDNPPPYHHQPPPPPQLPLPEPPGGCVGLKHGELYSRKGACPDRTSGPFNGRPRPGIRPPLLGPRRVLQHRHANISSGRPKWKTQTRNIEISSERGREGGGQ